MDQRHFSSEVGRLIDAFGRSAYSDARLGILWREVRDFSDDWFSRTVDEFIGCCRQAPILPEFREAAAKERERLYSIEKKKNAREAETFMSSYSAEDIQTICGQIRNRIQGKMSDSDFECFKTMIRPVKIQECPQCENTGFDFDEQFKGMTVCFCKKKY